ncbi:MAG: response regulator transcription factor [Thermomicrobiales bacterium]
MRELRSREERILLVEDEEPIRDLVATALRFTGFTVEAAVSGPEGLALARNDSWHLLVVDVNLPGLDGFSLTRKLREAGDTVPVIFLTARDDPADLREGFTGGGDDYLTKPFSLEELVLRIEAILRRGHGRANERARITVGELVLDDDAHRVWRAEREIELSPTEYRLLRFLMMNAGRVLSRPQIIEHVWDYGYAIEPSGVETYISYLRRKLDDREARLIRTVRGVGYALREPEPAIRGAGR